MQELFRWNELADQPHNIAPRRERFQAHWRHAGSYLSLVASNLKSAWPVWRRYRRVRRELYRQPVRISRAMGVAVSPVDNKEEEIVALLRELGVSLVLVRVPSWEVAKLGYYEAFIHRLRREGWTVLVALLQNRYDVLNPEKWLAFLQLAWERLSPWVEHFELGHAWNRTKWGLWSFREYLKIARPALGLASKFGVKLVGPAVIDFEFHLYPVILNQIPLDIVSSLLYVDRTGAPENAQWGWTLEKKLALLRAIIDSTRCQGKECWVTEFNWPLAGMGPYSPAPGRPCVSEEEQADFLVRYFILSLTSGAVSRVYWWQLAARGYGLVDPLVSPWQKRPSFRAFKTMVQFLEGSTFLERRFHPRAWIFHFGRGKERLTVAWTKQASWEYDFSFPVKQVLDRDGNEIPFAGSKIILTPRPKYVFSEANPV
jgi:hypothetical protein